MAQEPILCRFCWETSNTKKNPLIEPCECSGSIRFIHERCLNRWRYMDPGKNAEKCLLCLSPYNLRFTGVIPRPYFLCRQEKGVVFLLFAVVYLYLFVRQFIR